ncbi:MAG: hypothetical protein AW10_03200 [Candidatus Accumulibacter appositus]|uniref:Uncharacterized protein n=1 Tax=Candidatus Accumulibacter appositus TaxID=1454003 RepID=A0A011PMZ0_9PROT|nr:hypothetical protein [Accumulibacter sp.]EXI78230.1 MAG: hypothetical protein AW10_03200 [Candidatus Accumulibacter appositus]HRF06595.1 hypothetical protein [Accumulibacter sp.]
MKNLMSKCAAILLLVLCLPGLADARPKQHRCTEDTLRGQYVFTATGFTRVVNSGANTAWYPKAILEVLDFKGDGTLSTPVLTIANPFGDTGFIVHPPLGGAPGSYTINEDCSGTVQFSDANSVKFNIYVDPPQGDTIWMIQTNPSDNVFQGTAKRVR